VVLAQTYQAELFGGVQLAQHVLGLGRLNDLTSTCKLSSIG
jgi:hypothetical protein